MFLLGNWEPVGNTRVYKQTIRKLLRFPYMAIGNYCFSKICFGNYCVSKIHLETTEKSINTQAYHPASSVLLDVFYYTPLNRTLAHASYTLINNKCDFNYFDRSTFGISLKRIVLFLIHWRL